MLASRIGEDFYPGDSAPSTQTRTVLDRDRESGGRYSEAVPDGAGPVR